MVAAFRVEVAPALEDEAVAILWERGTDGIETVTGGGDRPVLLAYFSNGASLEALTRALSGLEGATVEAAAVPDVDWVTRFREGFQPFTAGGFRIVPEWLAAQPGPRVIVVDPGQAFGTGTHESTRLCLAALEGLAARGELGRVIDVGAGTGILGVAASLLGATAAAGVDLDPACLESMRRHARLNHVSLGIVRGDGGRAFRAASFDVVLANLTSTLLLDRAHELADLARPGGRLVIAGFLVEETPTLRACYETIGAFRPETQGEWAAAVVELAP